MFKLLIPNYAFLKQSVLNAHKNIAINIIMN